MKSTHRDFRVKTWKVDDQITGRTHTVQLFYRYGRFTNHVWTCTCAGFSDVMRNQFCGHILAVVAQFYRVSSVQNDIEFEQTGRREPESVEKRDEKIKAEFIDSSNSA